MSRPGLSPIMIRLAAAAAALSIIACGCTYGSLSPDRQRILDQRRAWIDGLDAALAYDEIFYLGDRGQVDPVTVKAVALDDALLARAGSLWPDDRRLRGRLDRWRAGGRLVVLVGLYSRNLGLDDDFLKTNPFQATLSAGAGSPLAPDLVELVEPAFLGDYFPVFNRWEKVLVMAFKAPLAPGSVLTVRWPTGSRELALAGAAEAD